MSSTEPSDEEVFAKTVWWPPILPLKEGEAYPMPQCKDEGPHPPMRGCCCTECLEYFDRKDEAPADGLIYQQGQEHGNEIDSILTAADCDLAALDAVSSIQTEANNE